MSGKEITLTFYGRRFLREDWRIDFDRASLDAWVSKLQGEYSPFQIRVQERWQEEVILEVNVYSDLLKFVRLISPQDGICNLCLGHIIGKSANCNLEEDIRRGVSRVAFAPEMVEPDGENKRVCHNCGCGC
jgi:hypothetical protein